MVQSQDQAHALQALVECAKVSTIKFGMNAPTWSRLQTRIINGTVCDMQIHILSTEIIEGQICAVDLRKSGIPNGSMIQLGCDFIYPCWLGQKVFQVDYQNGSEVETCLIIRKGRPEFTIVQH